jgi:NAD(P)-dependent dehydrogenase (short-subunit alcohol dehydrogenase family)
MPDSGQKRRPTISIPEKFFKRLKGKTAWITGGRRIGVVVARALAEQGSNIIVSYRSSEKEADRIARSAEKIGVKALSLRADVSDRSSMERAVKEAAKKFHRIDILVNMASVFGSVNFEKITERDMDSNIRAHLLGTFWPTQLIAPRMPRGSHIINISDRTSIGRVYRGFLPYVVTKKAVEGITRACAAELGEKGIFVNAIAPGPILAPPGVSHKEWKALRRKSRLKVPVDDREAVEQFALLVLYLSVVTMSSGNTYSLDQGQNL